MVDQVLEIIQIPRQQVSELPQNADGMGFNFRVRSKHTVLDGQLQKEGKLGHDDLEMVFIGDGVLGLDGGLLVWMGVGVRQNVNEVLLAISDDLIRVNFLICTHYY